MCNFSKQFLSVQPVRMERSPKRARFCPLPALWKGVWRVVFKPILGFLPGGCFCVPPKKNRTKIFKKEAKGTQIKSQWGWYYLPFCQHISCHQQCFLKVYFVNYRGQQKGYKKQPFPYSDIPPPPVLLCLLPPVLLRLLPLPVLLRLLLPPVLLCLLPLPVLMHLLLPPVLMHLLPPVLLHILPPFAARSSAPFATCSTAPFPAHSFAPFVTFCRPVCALLPTVGNPHVALAPVVQVLAAVGHVLAAVGLYHLPLASVCHVLAAVGLIIAPCSRGNKKQRGRRGRRGRTAPYGWYDGCVSSRKKEERYSLLRDVWGASGDSVLPTHIFLNTSPTGV